MQINRIYSQRKKKVKILCSFQATDTTKNRRIRATTRNMLAYPAFIEHIITNSLLFVHHIKTVHETMNEMRNSKQK